MTDASRRALKLAVEKARKLIEGPFVQSLKEQGGTSLTYTYTRDDGEGDTGGTVAIDHAHPDEGASDAFVLSLRFFIQDNERTSLRSLATHVLTDPDVSPQWKQGFTQVRDQMNAFLDGPSPIAERVVDPTQDTEPVQPHQLTYREILDVFVYGGLAHATPGIMEVFARWKANPLGFPFMQMEFDNVLTIMLQAIARIAWLSERELERVVTSPPLPDDGPDL